MVLRDFTIGERLLQALIVGEPMRKYRADTVAHGLPQGLGWTTNLRNHLGNHYAIRTSLALCERWLNELEETRVLCRRWKHLFDASESIDTFQYYGYHGALIGKSNL
jgi:hypothetical protein